MRTSNPTLNDKAFTRALAAGQAPAALAPAPADAMTVSGAVTKTALLTLLLIASATWAWSRLDTAVALLWPAAIGGLVIALVTVFKPRVAPVTAPLYAVAEGVVVGAVSALYEAQFPGIVLQAALATATTLIALLAAYRSGLIRATENFRLGVVAATGGIALLYLASFALRFVGVELPFLHDTGPVGIGISVVIVAVAALNLVLDFDFIERGAERRAPAHMEWYAAFGLLVTLVWLYLEILRLLGKLRSND